MANEDPTEDVPADRLWESQWYQIEHRTFEYYELFFDPDRILLVHGGESFRSFLIRTDGRERRSAEAGAELQDEPASVVLSGDRNWAIEINSVKQIRLAAGRLFRKPKLVIETDETSHEFYHHSRKHDISPLVEKLQTLYSDIDVLEK